MSIEERLVEKMEKDFQIISSYVEKHPMIKENACYSNNDDKIDQNLMYMSYIRPLFIDEDGRYLMMMVTEWKQDEQKMKTIYLWNGKMYSSFDDMVFSIKSQFSKFKMIFDFS